MVAGRVAGSAGRRRVGRRAAARRVRARGREGVAGLALVEGMGPEMRTGTGTGHRLSPFLRNNPLSALELLPW